MAESKTIPWCDDELIHYRGTKLWYELARSAEHGIFDARIYMPSRNGDGRGEVVTWQEIRQRGAVHPARLRYVG